MRFWIPATFLALAAVFVLDARRGVRLPIPPASGVVEADLALGPPRIALQTPTMQNGRYLMACSECHALFPSPAVPRETLFQHTHIRLSHGLNDSCYNCHDRANRDALVVRGGETIGFERSVELCAQCHGLVFRDWQAGIHGRTSGSWETNSPDRRRLRCSECHDPHSPAFPPVVPLPGPSTLRMGPPSTPDPHGQHENPLERWKAPAGEPPEEH